MKYLLVLFLLLTSCSIKNDSLPAEEATPSPVVVETSPTPTPFEVTHIYNQLESDPIKFSTKDRAGSTKEIAPNIFIIDRGRTGESDTEYDLLDFNEFKSIYYDYFLEVDQLVLIILDLKEKSISFDSCAYYFLENKYEGYCDNEFLIDTYDQSYIHMLINDFLRIYYDGYQETCLSCDDNCNYEENFSIEILLKYTDAMWKYIEENYEPQSTITDKDFYIKTLNSLY